MKVFIVPFSFCNLSSVERSLRDIGVEPLLLTVESPVSSNDLIILPGVGTFGQGMAYLKESGLLPLLRTHYVSNGYFLGICLGMQLFFQTSEESPDIEGLGFICGKVKKLDSNDFKLLPHMGWNSVELANKPKYFKQNKNNHLGYLQSDYYFVHNYYCDPDSQIIFMSCMY